jgi:hypothetical protein
MKYMADDLELELEDNDVEKRIKDLSKKVKLTSEERDEQANLVKERDEQLGTVSKERDFFKDFSGNIAKYPQATEYQDAIKERVMKGYTVEDATVSVLAKEGKLQTPATPTPPKENPAGGSATTNAGSAEKELGEMSKEEKRAALVDALGDKLSQ